MRKMRNSDINRRINIEELTIADVLIRKVEKLNAKKEVIEETIEKNKQKLKESTDALEISMKAHYVLTEVSESTQKQFKSVVEELITMAVKSVFVDRDYRFELKFEKKRNQFECRPVIIETLSDKREIEYDQQNDMGVGIIDITSFAMRVVLWALESPRSRNVFIMDEPLLAIGRKEELMLAGQMFREISEEMKLQLIIATHEDRIIEIADKSWHVEHKNGQSAITCTKE